MRRTIGTAAAFACLLGSERIFAPKRGKAGRR